MKNKFLTSLLILFFLTSCVGTSSTGIFGTGVTVAMDPRTLGTQIDDSIMDKSLDAKLVATNKNYFLNVKTKTIDGRIFITGKVDTVEEKLNITKNDNGLAAVMGHEIAHAVAKHSVERASRSVLLRTTFQITDILTGGKISKVNRTTGIDTVGLLAQLGIMNPFSRKQESEADYLGLIFSSLSGFDIRETIKVWERMQKANKGKEPPEFMSTHPSSTNRIKTINDWMNEVILEYPPIKLTS